MDTTIQIIAGIVVVTAYAGVQLRWIDPLKVPNLVMNFAGTGVLATIAVRHEQWGFVLTNGFWALISLASLVRLHGERRQAARALAAPEPPTRPAEALR